MGLSSIHGKHYKKPALWKRILKWAALSLLAIILTVGLAGFIFVYRTLGKIGVNTEVISEAQPQLDIPLPDEPVNVLLMGADNSPDGGPSRSDTMMLVRVSPQDECLSVLSFPRDLIADIPGAGKDKINAAYAIGGAPLAIETVKMLTDVPIHHFVILDFTGFEEAVDSLGGVYVDVDQRYFNDNSDAYWGEAYEPIDIYPGYQKLNGVDALDYVRYRHTDSDFMRIARQQGFVRDAKSQSMKWSNLTKIPDLADIFASYTTSDIGRSEVLSLIRFMLNVKKDRIHQAQIPIEELRGAQGNMIVIAQQALPEAIDQFLSPNFEPPAPPVPGTPAVQVPADKTKLLALEILNGNGVEGAASLAAGLLKEKGMTNITVNGNARNSYQENQIYYREGNQTAAEELATLLKPCKIAPMPTELSSPAQLLIVVGSAFEGRLSEKQPEVKAALHFEEGSTTGSRSWQQAAQQVPFQVQKPSKFPEEFDYVDFHPYEITTDDGPKPALKVVCENEAGQFWGIMETTFTEAPLLKDPSMEKEIGGKSLRFFYFQDKLKYLAWQDGQVVYWISNSLQNSLSEDTMIELALSFKPV